MTALLYVRSSMRSFDRLAVVMHYMKPWVGVYCSGRKGGCPHRERRGCGKWRQGLLYAQDRVSMLRSEATLYAILG